jgi:hypothetical protein
MQPVLRSYEEQLPDSLKVWALLTRGQQDVIDDLRSAVGPLQLENAALRSALEEHQRYLSILRRALPPKARAAIRAALHRG